MFGWSRRSRYTDELTFSMYKRMLAMSLDLSKLKGAVTRSTDATDKVLALLQASAPDPAVELANQAAVDAAAELLDAASGKVDAVLPLPPPEAPPAPVEG